LAEAGVNTPQGSFPGALAAAQGAAMAINKTGGIDGHPIDVITCNNENTPAGATKCAEQAAIEKVAAVIGEDPYGPVTAPVLTKAGIPQSAESLSGTDLASKINYPIGGGAWSEFAGLPLAAKAAGAKTVAIVCLDFPGFSLLCANTAAVAKAQGLKVVKQVPLSLTTTSFDATAQQLKSSGADAVLAFIVGPQGPPLVQAANLLGYHPIWVTGYGAFSPQTLVQTSKLASKLWVTSAFPPASSAAKYPGLQQYEQEMQAAAKAGVQNGLGENQVEAAVYTWLALHGVAQVARSIKGDVTAATLTEALKQARNIDIAGLANWSPGGTGPNLAYPRLTDNGQIWIGPVTSSGYDTNPTTPVQALQGATVK
jgi:ABC-type branched-subunit amino acid transport system substrate-binding protein